MVEHFLEQFPVIQVASMDPRFTKSVEEDRYPKAYSVTSVKYYAYKTAVLPIKQWLDRLSNVDFRKVEQSVRVIKIIYT